MSTPAIKPEPLSEIDELFLKLLDIADLPPVFLRGGPNFRPHVWSGLYCMLHEHRYVRIKRPSVKYKDQPATRIGCRVCGFQYLLLDDGKIVGPLCSVGEKGLLSPIGDLTG